jgi:transcription elongation factor GreB
MYLRQIDRRVRFLTRRLEDLKISYSSPQHGKVFFAVWLVLDDDNGQRNRYQWVPMNLN